MRIISRLIGATRPYTPSQKHYVRDAVPETLARQAAWTAVFLNNAKRYAKNIKVFFEKAWKDFFFRRKSFSEQPSILDISYKSLPNNDLHKMHKHFGVQGPRPWSFQADCLVSAKCNGISLVEVIICLGIITMLTGIWALKNGRAYELTGEELSQRQLVDLNEAIDAYRIIHCDDTIFVGDNDTAQNNCVLKALLDEQLIPEIPKFSSQLESCGVGENFYFCKIGNAKIGRVSSQANSFVPWQKVGSKQASETSETNKTQRIISRKEEDLCNLQKMVLEKANQDLR